MKWPVVEKWAMLVDKMIIAQGALPYLILALVSLYLTKVKFQSQELKWNCFQDDTNLKTIIVRYRVFSDIITSIRLSLFAEAITKILSEAEQLIKVIFGDNVLGHLKRKMYKLFL